MNDSVKSILWWICAIVVIALCIWGIHSCNKACDEKGKIKKAEEKAQIERNRMQEKAFKSNDQYMYVDRNGVYHIDKNCLILALGKYDDSNATYSVSYQPKSAISDWDEFASTHQLCTECFDSEVLALLGRKSQHKPDSVYVYDAKGKPLERTYYKYDSYGNIIKEETWKCENDKWVGLLKDVFEYDANGRKIMTSYYTWEHGIWVGLDLLGGCHRMTYDEYGNEICSFGYKWKGSDWEIDSKTEKEYDKYNNLIAIKYFQYASGKWQLETTMTYENYYQYTGKVRDAAPY